MPFSFVNWVHTINKINTPSGVSLLREQPLSVQYVVYTTIRAIVASLINTGTLYFKRINAMRSLSSFRKPDTNKTMGVEIEGYFNHNYDPYISDGAYYGFFYSTQDSSIHPPNYREWCSRELVSQPLPRNWLKKEVNKLFKKIKLHSNDSCGVHVHVSRKWLSEKKAHKIQAFYASLRPGEQELLFGRVSNTYCLTNKDITKDRYNAINATNANTIEFRMFKSGDAQWVCYCLDMVDYLIRQANTLNIDAALAFKDSWNA